MDKTVAGVLGAVSALAVTQAHAAPATPPTMDAAMQASSYADLLSPIPNALDLLGAEPAAGPVQPVQWYHHHHHHHRGWWHHHHHHWYGQPYAYNPYGYYGGYSGYGYNPYAYGYNPYTGY